MTQPRAVQTNEIEPLAEMIGTIFRLDTHYPAPYMAAQLRRPFARRDALVISENGRPVSHIRTAYSMVSIYGCEFKVASIGCVGTREEYRGRGYAGAILDASLRRMEERGAKLLIVSGDRSLYRRAHCVPAGRVLSADVGPDDLGDPEPGTTVRRVAADDWAQLAPLYQAEGVRFSRPVDFLSKRPFWWDCEFPELWLVERRRRPVAYVVLTRDWRASESIPARRMWEYAGARAGLLAGLRAIFQEKGLETIQLNVLAHDRELQYLLAQRGIALSEHTLGGTHRLIDLPGLMRKLRPYLTERLDRQDLRRLSFEQAGERCAIVFGDQRIDLSLSEAAPLVLGGPGAPALKGELARVVSQVLPIPFVMPGFDYV